MFKGKWRIARIHKLLGLVIGLQFLFWTVSGLFFTLYPIETIHGDPYRPAPKHGSLAKMSTPISAAEAAAIVPGELAEADLRAFLDQPVWVIRTDTTRAMVDATTGAMRSPLNQADIDALQARFWTSQAGTRPLSDISHSFLLEADPPREYGGPLPAWVIEYLPGGQRIYVDAVTGKVVAVRTTRWRIFDVLWRFHILDVTGEDEFDTWWMKLAAFLALTTVLTGIVMLVDRARRGALWR